VFPGKFGKEAVLMPKRKATPPRQFSITVEFDGKEYEASLFSLFMPPTVVASLVFVPQG
jgi:hypothetical protein